MNRGRPQCENLHVSPAEISRRSGRSIIRTRRDLLLENLVLRQQLTVLTRLRPQPRFAASGRLFWVLLQKLWLGWRRALIVAQSIFELCLR
jgi:hypothetical protein